MAKYKVDGEQSQFLVSYEAILSFATGCTKKPPAGFRIEPSLRFQSSSPYPTVNTCTIHLPLTNLGSDSFNSGILRTGTFNYC